MINISQITYILFLLGIAIVYRFIFKPLAKLLVSKTKTDLDDKIINAILNPSWVLILTFVIGHILQIFIQNNIIPKIFLCIEILIILFIIYRIISVFIKSYATSPGKILREEKLEKTAIHILENILSIFVVFIAFLMILRVWNIDITPILASVGIIGIAVGFALKDIIENILSGIIIFLDPPFRVGDIVEVDGKIGEIIDIGIRNTKIKMFDENILAIPNSQIINSSLVNYNLPGDTVRVTLRLGVSYDCDPEFVKKVIKEEILSKINTILKDPEPQVLFLEFGDSALLFEIRFWVDIKDKLTTIDEVNTLIWKVFKEKGIEIPFPIRVVYLKQ